jgi:hypothetical protein
MHDERATAVQRLKYMYNSIKTSNNRPKTVNKPKYYELAKTPAECSDPMNNACSCAVPRRDLWRFVVNVARSTKAFCSSISTSTVGGLPSHCGPLVSIHVYFFTNILPDRSASPCSLVTLRCVKYLYTQTKLTACIARAYVLCIFQKNIFMKNN